MIEKMEDQPEVSYTDPDLRKPEPKETTRLLGSQDGMEEEEQLTGCGATLACDPRRKVHRYLVLILMCLLSFGMYKRVQVGEVLMMTMMNEYKMDECLLGLVHNIGTLIHHVRPSSPLVFWTLLCCRIQYKVLADVLSDPPDNGLN